MSEPLDLTNQYHALSALQTERAKGFALLSEISAGATYEDELPALVRKLAQAIFHLEGGETMVAVANAHAQRGKPDADV